jgi:hypothetical protein
MKVDDLIQGEKYKCINPKWFGDCDTVLFDFKAINEQSYLFYSKIKGWLKLGKKQVETYIYEI